MAYYERWKPYVPVAKRRAKAQKKMAAIRKKGGHIQPIEIEGRKIARTFWGEAWCDHLESFSDYDNRLPRGRTYVRNGSVCHLGIKKGKIKAKVSGSEIYEIEVNIKTLSIREWNAIKKRCAGQIGSLIELLKGDLSDNLMQIVTDRKNGLFPKPAEISFDCDCPDSVNMCKHVAAVLYGVGTRLDQNPALLFTLRGVNHEELIDVDSQVAVPTGTGRGGSKRLASGDLADVFGIDLEPDATTASKLGASKLGASKLGASKLGASKLGASKLGASKLGASKLGASKPGASKPGASKLGASKPGASKPGASKPGASKPGASKPGASKANDKARSAKKKTRKPTNKKKTAKKTRTAPAKNTADRSSKKVLRKSC